MRILLFLVLLPCGARADIHEWKDENGLTHYSSAPPEGPAAKKKTRVVVHSAKGARVVAFTGPQRPAAAQTPQSPASGAPPTPEAPRSVSARHVELYTTSWCAACKAARAHLASRGVNYVEYDVETNPLAYAHYASYGGRGVPLAVIDGTAVRGFSREMYDRALEGR